MGDDQPPGPVAVFGANLAEVGQEVVPVPHDRSLRPVERRVLQLAESGMDDAEIARRFRHSPEWVARVRALAQHPRNGAHPRGDVLRPLERRVLRWRASGADYDELSPRFHRSPKFLQQVELLAMYKLRGGA